MDAFLGPGKEFKRSCNAQNLRLGSWEFKCSKGICTNVINETPMGMSHGRGWASISYKFNDEFRDLAVIKKITRTYELRSLSKEKGSF